MHFIYDLFNNSFLDRWEDIIVAFLHDNAFYAPMLLLIIEEAGVPLPVPGDIIIAYSGYQVSKGNISYWVAYIILLASVLIGSSILYYLSSRYGNALIHRFGKYLHVNERRLQKVEEQFRKYGPWVIIFGRHIPGFRIPITIFSGISKVSYKTFITSTFISVVFWIPFYLSVGKRLGPRTAKLFHAHPRDILFVIIPIIVIGLGYLFFRNKPQKKTKSKNDTK